MKQPTQQSNFRILLVEDDPGDVELIQILLTEQKSWAATLKNASTLSEGIALVQEDQEIDVVLLDLSLPDEYGLETFRPQLLLKKILTWTGGQPFLTQKICQMIRDCSTPIPPNREAQWLENLIQTQVIENWESQDEPEHLRTIPLFLTKRAIAINRKLTASRVDLGVP